MTANLFMSAVSDGGWESRLRQVFFASLILAATSGFLAVRMIAEFSRLWSLGGALAAGSLVLMNVSMLCVLFRDGQYDADTAGALAVVGSVTVQASALQAALYEIDSDIAHEDSAMTEMSWDGDRTRMHALRQARADIVAKLRERPAASLPNER